jgi:hypothetical protein
MSSDTDLLRQVVGFSQGRPVRVLASAYGPGLGASAPWLTHSQDNIEGSSAGKQRTVSPAAEEQFVISGPARDLGLLMVGRAR